MTNIVKMLQSSAMSAPSATAVDCDGSMTFSELWSATDSFAGGLQDREITSGDRVSVHVSDPRSFLIAVYGSLRAGCVPVTLPQTYENRAVRAVLSETDSKALVTDSSPIMTLLTSSEALRVAVTVDTDARMGVSLSALLENDGLNGSNARTGTNVVRRSDNAPGLIAYLERDGYDRLAVVHTHASLHAAASAGKSLLRDDGDDGLESHRSALSLSNPIEFMYGANATLADSGRYRPISNPDSETIRSLLVTTASDRAFITPRQYRDLRSSESSIDDRDLRIVESKPTACDGRDAGDAVRLCGLPETGISHVRTPEDIQSGDIGRSLPDVHARVLEGPDGDELAVTGPTAMDGYFGRPDLTDETTATIDGTRWIRTGLPVRSRDDAIGLGTESERTPTSTL